MAETIVEARHVSQRYVKRAGLLRRSIGTIQAVEDVSCALQVGQRLGLVGESGCGKTTLAKLLIGLLTPNQGQILVQGAPLASRRADSLRAARRAVQFVFQDPMNSLNPRMSIGETLAEPLMIHRLAVGTAARRQRVAALLESVQLSAAYAARLPRELSGGERQRVGIARALATEPQALICDEPIASLDVSVGAQILELLRTLSQRRQMALLFISHDLRAVASLCEQVLVMRQGQVVEEGPTETVLQQPRQAYTQLLIRCANLDLDTP